MKRMTFASMAALRAALMNLVEKPPGKVLIYGCKGAQRTFCKSIHILRNIKRLCSCSRLEIRGIGFYPEVEKAYVAYLKEQLTQKAASWWNCCSAHNWLRYNVSDKLNIVALHLSSVSYYVLVDDAFVKDFRKCKYGKKEDRTNRKRV